MYIGIDRGVTGAIAFLTDRGFSIVDIPIFLDEKRKKKLINSVSLLDIVKRKLFLLLKEKAEESQEIIVGIEPYLSRGVSSSQAVWGAAYQEGVFDHLFMNNLTYVYPAQWKKYYGLLHADKEESIEKAIELFPSAKEFLILKKHHNRAEALLIANYLRKK